MLTTRYWTSKTLVLLGAITLMGTACDANEAAPNGGEETWLVADAKADATSPVDQFKESNFMAQVDASTDLADIAPDEVSPAAEEGAEVIAGPGPEIRTTPVPEDLQTATFALG